MSGLVHQLTMGGTVTKCGLYFLPKGVAPKRDGENPDGLPRMPIEDGWKRSRDAEDSHFYGTNRDATECAVCFP